MSPMSVRDRPARPGDGSGICGPTERQRREQRERERFSEHIDALEEKYAGKIRRDSAFRKFRAIFAPSLPSDEELAAREPERPEDQ